MMTHSNTEHQYSLFPIASQARFQRLSSPHINSVEQFPLIGLCFENALVTYYLLDSTNRFNPVLVKGTTTRVADSLIQRGESVEEYSSITQLAGNTHFWVEVTDTNTDTVWTVDIASDTHDNLGEIIVTRTRPNAYIVLPDSYQAGANIISRVTDNNSNCVYCGSQISPDTSEVRCSEHINETFNIPSV